MQWRDVLNLIYNADNDGVINSFDRKHDRFYLLSCMKTPWYMWRKKKHILDLLNIMNLSHKENNLTDMQKVELSRTTNRVIKKESSYSDINLTASRAKGTDW